MCAQKSNANIDAVEIDEYAAEEANSNFKNSKWYNRLTMHQKSIQVYAQTCNKMYDILICNPPYYIKDKNYNINNQQRSKARHDTNLPFNELAQNAQKLLHNNGSFWLILPVKEAQIFVNNAIKNGLFLQQEISIQPNKNKPTNRVIQKWVKQVCVTIKKDFIVYELDGLPTLAYKNIAQNFYTGKQYQL
jgi:tRNA1Val (adenine37-N6)-methyltransferase